MSQTTQQTTLSASLTTEDESSVTDHELLHSYGDEELAQYIMNSQRHVGIFLLSPTLIAKSTYPGYTDAMGAMQLAASLGVSVPPVKRVVKSKNSIFLIMERIEGLTLEEAWPHLSWFATIRTAIQLRRYVCHLRSRTSSTAGALLSGECRSFYLADTYRLPPRTSPAIITSFIRFWTSFTSIGKAMQAAKKDEEAAIPPDVFIPAIPNTMVFTHHDLAPRNLLLDRSGKLWVIDWDFAGWYPKFFEYAAMQNFRFPPAWSWFARKKWFLFTWFTVGRFENERIALESNRRKFTRFAAGRRFEILANRSPAGRSCV